MSRGGDERWCCNVTWILQRCVVKATAQRRLVRGNY